MADEIATSPWMPDWDALYLDRIHPALAVRNGGVSRPRWLFVCGQQGSGKSTIVERLLDELGRDCSQRICSDDLSALLAELYSDPDDPEVMPALEAYRGRIRQGYVDALVEHAVGLRAHIVWELPDPGNIEGMALVGRALGFGVECIVVALPTAESWLSALRRGLADFSSGIATTPAVRWQHLCNSYRRWPTLLARAEAAVTFDRIAIIDRDGTLCFENVVLPDADPRQWTAAPFAFESLIVERARPRSPAAIAALLDQWHAIRAHPDMAFRNHPAWPWEVLEQFGAHLRSLAGDPASQFDLNDPGATADPVAASRWIARLRVELDDILAGPDAEGQATLAARCGRLIELVSQIAGQPTR